MYRSSFLLAFALMLSVSMLAQDKVLPAELKPFVTDGQEMLDFAAADMNGDGLKDYILILKPAGEDTMTFDNPHWDAPRILWMILRQPGGKLKAELSNSELVLCRQCGGAMGDPYMGLTVHPGEFTVDFYGGSSWKWGQTITFKYDKLKKNWFIQKDINTSSHPTETDYVETQAVIERSEIGNVSLKEYTPYYNGDTSTWKVTAAKTFFYDSPQVGSKPRKGYLLKGNLVKSTKKFKNFIECSFANGKGDYTYGYILRKDLILAASPKTKAIQ